ncbi:TlpA family protein disulfide reductase [uncultured Jatrophihabitans sp.]|uniref:TlpA family protein disulfide reductase n=1 Tax=uncultured Jatrophihabitans sp. TaxID=1610747 RepID=UPI0035C98E81
MKRRLAAAAVWAATLVAVPVLAACTGSNAVDQNPKQDGDFSFGTGTPLGQLYPVAERKKAGAFDGSLLDGGTFRSTTTEGKVAVINFWATWCGPCKTETPQFDSVYRQVRSRGVDFVGIDTKDVKDSAQAFVKNNKITYPIVSDEEGETAVELGKIPQLGLPFTVLLDKQGRVAAVYVVRLSPVDLTHSIDKLLAEK